MHKKQGSIESEAISRTEFSVVSSRRSLFRSQKRQLTNSNKSKRNGERFRKTAAIALLVIFCAPIVAGLFSGSQAHALNNKSQSDWSGGPGTSQDNQYTAASGLETSTANQLTVTGDISNWCNTANCSTTSTRRQAIRIINNDGPELTDRQVKISAQHADAMRSDFGDLRFTDETGTTDLDYYLYTKTDNTEAEIVVNIPEIAASATTSFYMYYGDSAATSLSTTAVTNVVDNFAGGSLDSNWGFSVPDGSGASVVVNDGILSFTGQANLYNTVLLDRSIDRTYEFDVKSKVSDQTCNDGHDPFAVKPSIHIALNFSRVYPCDGGGVPYKAGYTVEDGQQDTNPITNSPNFHDEFIRVKTTSTATSGTEFYSSTDGGKTYTKLNSAPTNNTDVTGLGFFTGPDSPEFSLRNVVGYNSIEAPLSYGVEEFVGGKTGSITSVAYDLGSSKTSFGSINVSSTGTGNIKIWPATSDSPTLATDTNYQLCSPIHSGQSLLDSNCATNLKRYVAYYIEFATDAGADLTVTNINFDYLEDSAAPTNASNITMLSGQGGSTISDGAWSRFPQPYFSWTAGSDNAGGSGIAGYCLYFGNDGSGDPLYGAGLISGQSPVETQGNCAYATSETSFNATADKIPNLDSNNTYYFRIRAIDVFGNLSADTASTSFRSDNQAPSSGTVFNLPTAVNTKHFRLTWLTTGNVQDNESGVAGYKYCVTTIISGLAGCDLSDQNWFGLNHSTGDIHDTSDVVPFSAGQITLTAADEDRLDDQILGINSIVVAVVDNAGNIANAFSGITVISHTASDAPENLEVTPTSNSSNAFSFSWSPPTLIFGSPNQTDYCWTVNEMIATDGSNCHLTGAGITQLASGPYATQQGENTFYIATKDVTGNFDATKSTSITFSASTTAPGTPQNLELSDVSIRATSTWKLAASWSAPDQAGSGIASYRILRSTDNATFTEVGSTSPSNTSFVDSGLNQTTYYYRVKACDNAKNCSVPTASESRRPTGRYTEPAKLTADSDQPREKDITTRKATVFWFTDRESDSKITIGTKSGVYNPAQIGNSQQTSNHNVNLSNLEPNTRYYYVASWTDSDGNTGHSQEHSFVTLPAPSFSDVNETNISVNGATVNFTSLNASGVKLFYGKSEAFGAVKSIDTAAASSTYSINLNDLEDGTKYFVKLNGLDPEGNEYQGDIYSFTTPARPRISDLAINTIEGESSSTKRITWKTNVPTSSVVTYKPTNGDTKDVGDSVLSTDHQIIVRGLIDDSDYTLKVTARDNAGNSAASDTKTFHTALDTRPPKIVDIAVESSVRGSGSEARGQVIVSWKTDEPASSQVSFGKGDGGKLTNRTAKDERLTLEHTVVVADIPTSSIYQLQIISNDKSGNSALSDTQTAIIGRAAQNVFTIIFLTLQKIFGIGN